jgi:hypothetical protein
MSNCRNCAAAEDVVKRFINSVVGAKWASEGLQGRGKKLLGATDDLLPILNFAVSAGYEQRNATMKDALCGVTD